MLTIALSAQSIMQEKPTKGLEPFVQEFFQDRLVELGKARMHVARFEFDELSKLAHKWKGFCDPYGFDTMGQLATKLEEAALAHQKHESIELLNHIDQYLQTKSQFIGHYQ